MIPVPEVRELQTIPAEFMPLAPELCKPQPAPPSDLATQAQEYGVGALLRFKSLMAAEGEPVHLSRVCYDRLYAYERFAVAHASGNQALRYLALELFQIFHRQPTFGLPTQ